MNRTWCNQIRFNKSRECIPRGFRLLDTKGIKEWNGEKWLFRKADEVAVLSIGRVKQIA